jgi:hypothetical protein
MNNQILKRHMKICKDGNDAWVKMPLLVKIFCCIPTGFIVAGLGVLVVLKITGRLP